MRYTKIYFLLTVCFFLNLQVSAQDIQEIIKRNIVARGGKALLEKLKSQAIDAEIDGQMGKIPMNIYVKDGVGFKQEFEMGGMKNYMILFKNEGWMMMPVQGMKEPQKMDEKMVQVMKRNMNIKGDFMNPESTLRYELHGVETVNGEENYRIAAINENNKTTFIFISTQTFLKSREIILNEETGEEMNIEYSNYRKTPEGYTMPYSMTTIMGKMTIKNYKINTDLKDQIFMKTK